MHPHFHLLPNLCPGLQTRASSCLLMSAVESCSHCKLDTSAETPSQAPTLPQLPGRTPGLDLGCLPMLTPLFQGFLGTEPLWSEAGPLCEAPSPSPTLQAIHSSGPFSRPRSHGREGASNRPLRDWVPEWTPESTQGPLPCLPSQLPCQVSLACRALALPSLCLLGPHPAPLQAARRQGQLRRLSRYIALAPRCGHRKC